MKELTELLKDGFITEEQYDKAVEQDRTKPISVHWELRTILYLGILLFTSGISVLIYLNIDTIGHQAIIAFVGTICIACFYYAYKHQLPYSNFSEKQDSPFFDYIILLGCLLFALFVGYLQFQYSVFGFHYGIATLIPALLFFFCAYLFDHKGILSLAITGIAAWAGLSVTPMSLLQNNDFSNTSIIYTALAVGLVFTVFSCYAHIKNIKQHFDFTYNNFSANILYIASLSALFSDWLKLIGFLFLTITCVYYFKYAIKHQSFWFLLLSVIYGYIGLTYCIFNLLSQSSGDLIIIIGMIYVMASCAGIVLFFLYYKRILKLKK